MACQAADVPIVKLNPLNILTVKAEGEKELREVGIHIKTTCSQQTTHTRVHEGGKPE